MFKLMLVGVLLFCFQISDIMTVHANGSAPGNGDVEQQAGEKRQTG